MTMYMGERYFSIPFSEIEEIHCYKTAVLPPKKDYRPISYPNRSMLGGALGSIETVIPQHLREF